MASPSSKRQHTPPATPRRRAARFRGGSGREAASRGPQSSHPPPSDKRDRQREQRRAGGEPRQRFARRDVPGTNSVPLQVEEEPPVRREQLRGPRQIEFLVGPTCRHLTQNRPAVAIQKPNPPAWFS